MTTQVLKLQIFIRERLKSEEQWDRLHELIGISSYRKNYLFNNRLDEFRYEEIKSLSGILEVHPAELVFGFGVGEKALSFSEAKALGLIQESSIRSQVA